MVSNVADVIADLTEIAAFVFAADQAVSRSGNKKFDYGDKWIRDFRFEIAIRCPDFWNESHVLDCLSETLHFLTADNFEFRFSKNHMPTPFSSFLGLVTPIPREFSGSYSFPEVLIHRRVRSKKSCTTKGK